MNEQNHISELLRLLSSWRPVSLTSRAGKIASIRCGGINNCDYYVFWYQKKESGTFELLLNIYKSSKSNFAPNLLITIKRQKRNIDTLKKIIYKTINTRAQTGI
uniref:Immunoglobulin V-set domain-containing protein n=1 Tax=Takifugu rubripes TaxID=31033 RepID=A0A674NB02_TAKRU